MMKELSLKLLFTIIVFAIVTISIISITTRYLLIKDVASQQQQLRTDIEKDILSNLTMIDKAHFIFQEIDSEEAESGLKYINQEFNYNQTINQLINNHTDLIDLRVLTESGSILNNETAMQTYKDMDEDIQKAYLNTVETGQKSEVIKTVDGGVKETHHFVSSEEYKEKGGLANHIIYMKYSNKSERELIRKNTIQFFIMLTVGIFTSCILLLILLKILHNTIRLAMYDSLTGAYNRASYLQYMDQLINSRQHFPVGLVFVDLDNFKQVNDVHGHAQGDDILCAVTDLIKKVAKKEGYVVRFGGDEFAIVYKKATKELLKMCADELLAEMRHRKATQPDTPWSLISLSIGATLQQELNEEEMHLYDRADKALYLSKSNGKDGYTYNSVEPPLDMDGIKSLGSV